MFPQRRLEQPRVGTGKEPHSRTERLILNQPKCSSKFHRKCSPCRDRHWCVLSDLSGPGANACISAWFLGGGVAGMTAAHELVQRGFEVTVFELHPHRGVKARSFAVHYPKHSKPESNPP